RFNVVYEQPESREQIAARTEGPEVRWDLCRSSLIAWAKYGEERFLEILVEVLGELNLLDRELPMKEATHEPKGEGPVEQDKNQDTENRTAVPRNGTRAIIPRDEGEVVA